MKFPDISVKTLKGEKLEIPAGLKTEKTLLILVFEDGGRYEEPQAQAAKWIQWFEENFKEADYLELAMMSRKYRLMSFIIDSGMRSGIPQERHENVAAFYGDKRKYMQDLGIYDLRRAYVYLLGHDGKILFKTSGEPKDDHLGELSSIL